MAEMPPPIALPDAGEVVNERYRVVGTLGKGGMGQVFRVHDVKRQQDVALKYLSVPKDKPSAIDRFKAEFSKLAQFPHPNISAVYDFGHDDTRDLYFFTAELIDGRSFFDGTRGMTPLETEALVVQTLRALEYLHNHHLVHYDIKPGNVLITQNDAGTSVAKVIDFGVADFGFHGRLVGTPSYMAPEMTRREIPDQRADLYSLGIMWYQAMAGLPDSPFRGANRDETFYNQQTKVLPPLQHIHSSIPLYMDRIIERLLSKKPGERFPYAAAVISEINLAKANPAERYEIETRETRQSYIPSNARFVGREDAIGYVRQFLQAHLPNHGATEAEPSSPRETHDIAWVTGTKGVGKSRLLGEMRHIAQLNGFDVVDAAADDPGSWDGLRSAIQFALEHPADPILLCIESYEALAVHPEATALMEDLERLQHFLHSMHNLGSGAHCVCLALTAYTLPRKVAAAEVLHIPLKPFTDIELSEYVRAVTGFEVPPEGFVEELMRYTEGNPYFVTELMRALIDQNILFDTSGRWKATTFEDLGVDFSAIRIPGTLADALGMEYNQLSSPEQQLLSIIAVWGGPATASQLEQILQHRIDPATPLKLLKKGWIDLDIATNAMTIPNPNRRMAVEALQPPPSRAQWHHAIAELLDQEGATEPEHIHWHFAHGHHPTRALDSQWTLAEHYSATQRPLAAISILQKILQRGDVKESMRHRATLLLARTYRSTRRFDEAMGVLEGMERDLRRSGNHHELHARVWEEMAITANKQRRYADAERYCMKGLRLVQHELKDEVLKLRIENYLGQTFLMRGFVDRAIETFKRTRDEAAQLSSNGRLQILNNELCNAFFEKGDYNAVITESQRDLVLYEEAGNTRQYLRTNLLLAKAYRNLRQAQKAGTCLQKGIEMARTRHDMEYLFYNYQDLGSLYSDTGKLELAAQNYERALDLASRMLDPIHSITVKCDLGVLHSRLGKSDLAERDFLTLVDYMRLHPPSRELAQMYACRAHLELGDMYVKQSRYEEAGQHLDAAEALVHKYANCGPLLFSIQLTRAELHRDMGDKTGAKKMLEKLRKTAHSPEEMHQLDITETTIEEPEV